MKKKLLLAAKVVGVCFGVLALAFGGLMGATFWNIEEAEGGDRVGAGVTVDDGYVTCHVVDVGGGEVALVDACVSEDGAAIVAQLAELGYRPEDVAAILLTHGHGDHRGAVGVFEGARLYAHRDERPLLMGEVRARGPIPWMSGYAEPLPTTAVRDGEVIPLGPDADARAFHMPGHTAGSCAWLIGETLFLGDAGVARGGRLDGDPWVFSDDVDAADATLAGLAARLEAEGIAPEWLVFSHSAPLRGMEPLREFARSEGR